MKSAPKLFTSSAASSRTSKARTTAPSRRAVEMADSPATPHPSTTALAGRRVPAGVTIMANTRGRRAAASKANW